jgi:hypothetical protein
MRCGVLMAIERKGKTGLPLAGAILLLYTQIEKINHFEQHVVNEYTL